jgi:hypothetical protein
MITPHVASTSIFTNAASPTNHATPKSSVETIVRIIDRPEGPLVLIEVTANSQLD